jgi:hypothetical protein
MPPAFYEIKLTIYVYSKYCTEVSSISCVLGAVPVLGLM